ncbi:MAG: CDP-alcohol phosphatidyltransferase family protein, partial [Gemmatimonadaceae bacterium]
AMGPLSPHTTPLIPGTLGVMLREGGVAGGEAFPFVTPFGLVGLPWWVLAIVLGRELFMTISRQIAARRGVVIGAMDLAKWKTGFQWTWVGSTFFWFFAATLASDERWRGAAWTSFAWFNAFVGLTTMTVAVLLTLYTLWLYVRRYGSLLVGGAVTGRAK